MKVRIHRGSKEIGGSCIEVESGGQRILLDAGLPLTRAEGTDHSPPSVDADSLLAILISHPHLDHYGLLPQMPKVPTVMGQAARRILAAAAPYMPYPTIDMPGPDLQDRKQIQFGPFRVTPFLVDHSAYDAYALLIEAEGKRLFYSGDFRMHGRKRSTVERLMVRPPPNIDALLLEGTTLSRTDEESIPDSEAQLEGEFEKLFRSTPGLALVHASAQNIDRVVTLYRACLKAGRTLVVDLYTALILEATGNPAIPQSNWDGIALCIPQRQRIQIKKNGWFETLEEHARNRIYLKRHVARNPGRYVLLFRGVWMRDLEQAGCLDGSCLVHSQWEGYLKELRSQEIHAWRESLGIPLHIIHTSGHASPADLRRFATALAPRVLVPIHSSAPDEYGKLYPHVVRHEDGKWWNV